MSSGGEKRGSWIQCTTCGEIHKSVNEYSIDEMYVNDYCLSCGSYRGLNLGNRKEEIYEFYDVNLDVKYYTY